MMNLVQKNYETQNYTKQQASFGALNLNGCSKRTLYKAIQADMTGVVRPSEVKHETKKNTKLIITMFQSVLKRFNESKTHDLTLTLKPEGAKKHTLTAEFGLKGNKEKVQSFSLSDGNKLTKLLHDLREMLPAPKN